MRVHQIQCLDVLLEDTDVVKALTEYVSYAAIENLVLGAPAKHGFIRYICFSGFSACYFTISNRCLNVCSVCVCVRVINRVVVHADSRHQVYQVVYQKGHQIFAQFMSYPKGRSLQSGMLVDQPHFLLHYLTIYSLLLLIHLTHLERV